MTSDEPIDKDEFRRAYERELENKATTPGYQPTLRWLLERVAAGEMTAQEFVRLSKQRGKFLREYPLDTRKDSG